MRYPLNLRFKIAAIASQIYVTDADGNEVFYVKQKLFKLKENIEIYSSASKEQILYTIKTDRIIDFSPEFTLFDSTDQVVGSVKRHGGRSIWKTTYDVTIGNDVQLKIHEMNPWTKVIDAFFSEIPILGLFGGYFFHPKYQVTDTSGNGLALLTKLPAFLEGKYSLDNTALTLDDAKQRDFAALIMIVVLRERLRG